MENVKLGIKEIYIKATMGFKFSLKHIICKEMYIQTLLMATNWYKSFPTQFGNKYTSRTFKKDAHICTQQFHYWKPSIKKMILSVEKLNAQRFLTKYEKQLKVIKNKTVL